MILNAPAKLNLTFEITGRREDGYHYIRSIMQTVDIYDRLKIDLSDHLELTGAMVAPPQENIITRAVRGLEGLVGRKLPCCIHLDKSIPIGAGLGGGSSDAAAVIYALNRLYELGLSPQAMMEVGAQVGADVPFFLVGGKCLVEGIGEKVTLMDPDEGRFLYLIFRPHWRRSSRQAYEDYDRTGKTFVQQARERCTQLDAVFQFFRDATVSGKGPTTWVKRDYFVAYIGDEQVSAVASGLESFMKDWNGDFFFAQPVFGCCEYSVQEWRSLRVPDAGEAPAEAAPNEIVEGY